MRRLGLGRSFAAWCAFAAFVLWTAHASVAHADCIVVQERTPQSSPHVVLHFGGPADVPTELQCVARLDRGADSFSIPIYAYNLWAGADAFELALALPRAPLGIDPGPAIVHAALDVAPGRDGGVLVGLQFASAEPVCGPVLLGKLRIATADLPEDFSVTVDPHPVSGLLAARDPDARWRTFVVDAGGARVGHGASCPRAPCAPNKPIADLTAMSGMQPGLLDLAWTSGSGTETWIAFRTDGRAPADPWDGKLLALLPSAVTSYTHRFDSSGTVHLAAWSITRGPSGKLDAVSPIECGALVSAHVHLPVGVSPRSWGQVKTTYR
jgi:hypothetical protein